MAPMATRYLAAILAYLVWRARQRRWAVCRATSTVTRASTPSGGAGNDGTYGGKATTWSSPPAAASTWQSATTLYRAKRRRCLRFRRQWRNDTIVGSIPPRATPSVWRPAPLYRTTSGGNHSHPQQRRGVTLDSITLSSLSDSWFAHELIRVLAVAPAAPAVKLSKANQMGRTREIPPCLNSVPPSGTAMS